MDQIPSSNESDTRVNEMEKDAVENEADENEKWMSEAQLMVLHLRICDILKRSKHLRYTGRRSARCERSSRWLRLRSGRTYHRKGAEQNERTAKRKYAISSIQNFIF